MGGNIPAAELLGGAHSYESTDRITSVSNEIDRGPPNAASALSMPATRAHSLRVAVARVSALTPVASR
jgi:hypothetical protein